MKKYIPALIIVSVFGLAGAGLFTATRLYQLGTQRVAPNAPQSEPSAWDCSGYTFNVTSEGVVTVINNTDRNEPSQTADVFIDNNKVATFDVPGFSPFSPLLTLGTITPPANSSFSWRVVGSLDCQNSGNHTIQTPTPTVSASPSPTPTTSASPTPTPTATVEPTPTPTASVSPNTCQISFTISAKTPTPTPSQTPTPACDSSCTTDSQCQALDKNLVCYSATRTCRNVNAPERNDCSLRPSGTPTSTPTPRFECNSRCSSDSECKTIGSTYSCVQISGEGRCRDTRNSQSATCQVSSTKSPSPTASAQVATTTPTVTPVSLPAAGFGLPTVATGAAALVLLAIAAFFAF